MRKARSGQKRPIPKGIGLFFFEILSIFDKKEWLHFLQAIIALYYKIKERDYVF